MKGNNVFSFFVMDEKYDETNVYLGNYPDSIKKRYQLRKGVSRLNNWPTEVVFEYSNHRPEGMILTDWVKNRAGLLIISDRFKKTLSEFDIQYLEYLPIQIMDHKKRIVSESYWIANFVILIEAIDKIQSIFKNSPGNDGKIFTFKKFVLKNNILQNGPKIFRLKEQPMLILIRNDLKERIESEKLTGIQFIETDNYISLNPDN